MVANGVGWFQLRLPRQTLLDALQVHVRPKQPKCRRLPKQDGGPGYLPAGEQGSRSDRPHRSPEAVLPKRLDELDLRLWRCGRPSGNVEGLQGVEQVRPQAGCIPPAGSGHLGAGEATGSA